MKQALSLLFLFLLSSPTLAEPYQSAACFVKTADGLLMIKDHWSKKYSLPGGIKRPNESEHLTASRETYEETGVRVKVGALLVAKSTHRIFRCHPFGNPSPLQLYPADGRNEVAHVSFVDVHKIDPKKIRFPHELDLLKKLNQSEPAEKAFLHQPTLLRDPNEMEKMGIEFIREFQLKTPQWVNGVFQFLSFMGDEKFFYLLLPFLFFLIPPPLAQKALLLIIFTALLNGVLKEFFQWPRPFEFDLSIQLRVADGYGFPSGHSQLAFALWGFLGLYFRKFLWFLPIIVGIAFSRVANGVHFPHDIIVGLLVGALTLWYFQKSKWIDSLLENPKKLWIPMGLLCLISFLIRPHPSSFSISCFTIGFLLGLPFCLKTLKSQFDTRTKSQSWVSAIVLILGILLWTSLLKDWMIPKLTVGWIAILLFFKYFGLGLWLTWGSAKIALCWKK